VTSLTYSFCLRGTYADLLDFTDADDDDTGAGAASSSDSSESYKQLFSHTAG